MADMTEIQKNLANTMAKDEGARMADFMGNPAAYLTGLGISFQSLPPQAQGRVAGVSLCCTPPVFGCARGAGMRGRRVAFNGRFRFIL